MSIQAMVWAMTQQRITDPGARHALLCLANYAGEDGRGAFPSVATLSRDSGMSRRTLQRKLDDLEGAGVIVRGNQALAAVYIDRPDRRPVVYDLLLERGDAVTPRTERGDSVTPRDGERGVICAGNGVSSVQERGVTVTPNTSLTHQQETHKAKAPVASRREVDYPDAFERLWKAYPQRGGPHSKREALGQWQARLKQGHTEDQMQLGVDAYHGHLAATGRLGTEYVKMARTFLGPNLHFLDEYPTPVEPTPAKSATRAAIEQLVFGGRDELAEARAARGDGATYGALPAPNARR